MPGYGQDLKAGQPGPTGWTQGRRHRNPGLLHQRADALGRPAGGRLQKDHRRGALTGQTEEELMLDLKWFLANIDSVRSSLEKRGQTLDLSPLEALNQKRKALQTEFDGLRSEQNKSSTEIQNLQKAKQDASPLLAQMQKIAGRVKAIGPELKAVEDEIEAFLLKVPNIPHESVPVGRSS